jgi:endonuclease YncB( thermonuclease family)
MCLLPAAILALALGSARAAEWIVEGRVVGISDGDTITILDDAKTPHKIRFVGIDAPERKQPYGDRSRQSLSALVFQKRVELRCHKKDRYGEVCAVFVGLRDVGLEQIRQGVAWHYKAYQHEQTTQDRLVYRDEEDSAKARRVGLWSYPSPVAPWKWRKERER